MGEFLSKHQRSIGILFIGVAIVIFADKALDLGYEAMPLLGQIMIAVILFTIGYAFVVHPGRVQKRKDTETKQD